MKQYITMKKIDNSVYYQFLEPMEYRFAALTELFSPFIRPGELIDWLSDEKQTVDSYECLDIYKERGAIALYDTSDGLNEDVYISIFPDQTKRFEMSVKNFAEIIYKWEELRVNRPDIILIVIHEDNHVSLEADPVIVKQYQDSGYAFDIDKK